MLKFAMVYTVFNCRTHCFNVRLLKPYIYILSQISTLTGSILLLGILGVTFYLSKGYMFVQKMFSQTTNVLYMSMINYSLVCIRLSFVLA